MVFGGGKRDRTDDLLHAMQALSQLSYTPVFLLLRAVLLPAHHPSTASNGAVQASL
jgi:hypothetical protein